MMKRFDEVVTVVVRTEKGREYKVQATRNPEIAGGKADKERDLEAKAEGKVNVYNVKMNSWQKLNVVKIQDGDQFVEFKVKERKRPERLSLENAKDIIDFAYDTFLRKNKEGEGYIVSLDGVERVFADGFAVVRFAKELIA